MCGISGIFTKKTNSLDSIHLMNQTLFHRGPDNGDIWINKQKGIGLGFRRLSILDLSVNGNQPMHSNNGRYIIILNGLCRFKIVNAVKNDKLYKEFIVDYSGFENDLDTSNMSKTKIDTDSLITKVKLYFKKKNYLLDWDILKKMNQTQLIDTICMISPLSVEEKQKLLESKKIDDKLLVLNEILNFNLKSKSDTQTIQ